jgi:hypothetical protein
MICRSGFQKALNERICRLCKLEVENEIHFLLECPSLANTRREILDQIESRFSNLKFFDNKSKFVWFLSADDHYIISSSMMHQKKKEEEKSYLIIY